MNRTYQQLQELLDQYQITLQADSLTTSNKDALKQLYVVMKRIQSFAIIGLVRDVFSNNFDNLIKYAKTKKQLVDEHIKALEKEKTDSTLIDYYIEERMRLINLIHQPEAFIGYAVNCLNSEGIESLLKLFDVDYSNLIKNGRIDTPTVRLAIEMLNGNRDNYQNILELDNINASIEEKLQFNHTGLSFDFIIALMIIRDTVVKEFNKTIENNDQSLLEQFLCNENNLERNQFEQIINIIDELLKNEFIKIKNILTSLFLSDGSKMIETIPNLKKMHQLFQNVSNETNYFMMQAIMSEIIPLNFELQLPDLYQTLKRCGAKGSQVLQEHIIISSKELLKNEQLFKTARDYLLDIDAKVFKYYGKEIVKDQKKKTILESKIPSYIKDADYNLAASITQNRNPMVRSDLQLLLLIDASLNRQAKEAFESIEDVLSK